MILIGLCLLISESDQNSIDTALLDIFQMASTNCSGTIRFAPADVSILPSPYFPTSDSAESVNPVEISEFEKHETDLSSTNLDTIEWFSDSPKSSQGMYSSSQTDPSSSQCDNLTPTSELESSGSSRIFSSGSSRSSGRSRVCYKSPHQNDRRLASWKTSPQSVRFEKTCFCWSTFFCALLRHLFL